MALSAEERLRVQHEQSAPHLTALEAWLRDERAPPVERGLRSPNRSTTCSSIRSGLRVSWATAGSASPTTRGRARAAPGFALGRKSWLFAGSERGATGPRAMATLIMTAKLNDVDPRWPGSLMCSLASRAFPQSQLHELLPWQWKCAPAPLQLRRPDHYDAGDRTVIRRAARVSAVKL